MSVSGKLATAVMLLIIATCMATSIQIYLLEPLPVASDAQALAAALNTTSGDLFRAAANSDGSFNILRAATAFLCGEAGIIYDAPYVFTAVGLFFFLLPFILCLTRSFRFLNTTSRSVAFSGILLFALYRTVDLSTGLAYTPALAALVCMLIALFDYDYETKRSRYLARGLAVLCSGTGLLPTCLFPAFALRYYRTRQRDLGLLSILLLVAFVIQFFFAFRMLGSELLTATSTINQRFVETALPVLLGAPVASTVLASLPSTLALLLSVLPVIALLVAAVAYALEHQKWPLLGAFSGLITLLFFIALLSTNIDGSLTACIFSLQICLTICSMDRRVPIPARAACLALIGFSVVTGASQYIRQIEHPRCIATENRSWEQSVSEYVHMGAKTLPVCPAGSSISISASSSPPSVASAP